MSHLERIIANATVGNYPIPKADTPKLASVDLKHAGSDDPLFLLAAYCFDAQRKLLYFCKAALPLLEHADPEFRRRAQKDTDDINNQPNWEARARKAEEIMLRLQKEVGGSFLELEGEPALTP